MAAFDADATRAGETSSADKNIPWDKSTAKNAEKSGQIRGNGATYANSWPWKRREKHDSGEAKARCSSTEEGEAGSGDASGGRGQSPTQVEDNNQLVGAETAQAIIQSV